LTSTEIEGENDNDSAINQSQTTTTKKIRNTREQLTVKLTSIRSMMLDGATNTKIMSTLNIPQRTFYRYMDKIYQEDRIELAKKNKQTLATHILFLRERLMQSIRNCQNIALDPKVSAKDRIEAERLKLETSIAIVKLEVEGTTITQVNQYDGHQGKDNGGNNLNLIEN
jgi:hypothetical protein